MSGQSWVKATDLETGAVQARADLAPPMFGEGITVKGDTVWQLTWRDGVAIARSRDTLAEERRIPYDREGWGICALSDDIVTSDGSATLTFRDPVTLEAHRSVQVSDEGVPVDLLNELECADAGTIYANVWTTDSIVAVHPADGKVTAVIDARNLRELLPAESTDIDDVLNGIARIPETDRFLVTGKHWPLMFEVRFGSLP